MDHGWGSATWFSESYPLLIDKFCLHTYFYDEFWQKHTLQTTFCQFQPRQAHPCVRKICWKGTIVREIWIHMGGTYLYPEHGVSPLPQGEWVFIMGVYKDKLARNLNQSSNKILRNIWLISHLIISRGRGIFSYG